MAVERVVLVGMMGAGKTTVGRALAARLGWPYLDNDAELRRRAGRSAAEVLAASGVEALHELEATVLDAALAAAPPVVLAAPGSAALDPSLAARLAGLPVVWLRASPATLAARVGAGGEARPFLGSAGSLAATVAALEGERRAGFAAVATLVVDVDALSVSDVVDTIVESLGLG